MSLALDVTDLHWRYPSFSGQENPWVLRGVNLSLADGQILGITGPSGAGKTTLCRLMLGVLPHGIKIPFRQVNHHIQGQVQVLGETVTRVDPAGNVVNGTALGKLEGLGVLAPRIGMVMQDPENQFLTMSVLHELAFGLALRGLDKTEILSRSEQALNMVGLAALWPEAGNTHPADLSGGQKQRVAIASFLALQPEVLILDEPTSDLDPLGKHEVIDAIRRLKEAHGMTIVLVEHDPELLHSFCDRIALLDEGRIVAEAAPGDFYAQTTMLEAHGVAAFEVTRIARLSRLGNGDRAPVSIDDLAQVLLQRPQPAPAEDKAAPLTDAVIEAAGLEYAYPDGTLALRGAELTVQRGEMVALLGINGSGKTTLAKVLAGLIPPEHGQARVLGQNLGAGRIRRELPRHVGYIFQNPDHQLFTRRVYDEVAYGLINMGLPAAQRDTVIRKTLATVGLADVLDEDPLFLGKGQRQRLAVASVLAMGPEILIVDEPTTGQDHRMIAGVMSLLDDLNAQGKTILIITHDMTLVADHCSRAVVLLAGQTVFNGAPRQLFADRVLLDQAHLRAPQAIRLSLALRATLPDYPILLNVDEWVAGLAAGEKATEGGSQ
jgi:energy-coupling factor transporter ATP-binding protein EcfA2